MTLYNHAFDIAFTVITKASCETEDDYPTPQEIRIAILKRLAGIDDDELMEAVNKPFDTYEEE